MMWVALAAPPLIPLLRPAAGAGRLKTNAAIE
jgi:hypothetical protein